MNKIRKISILAFLVLTGALMAARQGYLFAETRIPVTAVAQVAPEGEFSPVITASDQTLREGDTLEFEVSATDANAENSVRLEILQGQPPWLTIISNTDGNPAAMRLSAAPPTGADGRYRVFFKATDNSPYDLSATKDIFVIVNAANRAPVITAQDQITQINRDLSFTVSCEDPDTADTVTFAYAGTPSWLTASDPSPLTGNPTAVTFGGTPQPADAGVYTITFNASDNGTPRQSVSRQITITVTPRNDPPALEAIRDKQTPIRVKLEFTINASDPNGDPLTYSASGVALGMGASFDPLARKFTWTPLEGQVGNYQIHFEVSDGTLTDSEDITVYVTSQNAPVFDPLDIHRFDRTFIKRVRVGKEMRFAVTARDPNNDPIIYGALNMPAGAVFDADTHTFTWSPQPGQEGTYRVTFTASDSVFTTSIEILVIAHPSDGPVLSPVGEKYIRPGQTLSFELRAEDPDTLVNQLTFSVSNNPPGSSLAGPRFTWTPAPGQVGTWRDIIFTVSDGTSSDSSNAWIFVLANGAPAIERIGEKRVVEGRTLEFTVNATDPDGDPLTYLAPANAPRGSRFDPLTRTFTWTPVVGERGVYNDIIFSVTDGINTTSDNTWIFVDANDGPVVEPLFEQHVKATNTLSFDVSAYDPNGDFLTYKALNLPAGATFEDRTFRWTPTLEQVGIYNDIIFEVSDGVNVVSVRTWIFVDEPGAPVMERVGERYVTAGETLTFTVSATDPDSNALSYSASNLPTGATFDPSTRRFNWTPDISQVGTYPNVLFHVTDGVYTTTEICWIFVKGQGAPVIDVPGEQRVRAGSALQFTINASDPNTPAAGLAYSASNLPPGATFADQVFRWTPSPGQIGTYPDINFTVSDGAYSDSRVTWIYVTSPGAPEFIEDITSVDARPNEPLVFTIQPADDPDNAPGTLFYSGINLPQGSEFLNRTFRWTPQTGQEGTYKNVRFEVTDPDNNVDSDIFWIYVTRNRSPALDQIGTKFGGVSQPLTFTISASDADNDPLTFSARNLPAGAVFDPANRRFSWTPNQSGTFTRVHFEVSDGTATDSEDISIIISQ
ncbi:MAG: putative Ig domain-containing protein [Candidatus Omnitrophica bacterium]|nr:putative Ig domain-containing protein [Candidatus Omnitrophota bacterium]